MIELPFAVMPLDLGAITSGNERDEYPAEHLGFLKHIALTWRSAGAANVWARGDMGDDQSIDFCALISANALPATTIRLRLHNAPIDDATVALYDGGALPLIDPAITRADGLYHSHLALAEPLTARYWRIDIGGHTGDFIASSLVLGRRLQPATYYDSGFKFEANDLGSLQFNRWGVPDETDGLVFRALTVKFGWLSQVDYETKFRQLAEQLGSRGVVYFCFDPEPTIYRQAKTYLGVFKEAPYATGGVKPGSYESEFQILSMI